MKLRKITAAAMSALLAMLGYSCSKDDPTESPWGDYICAYGTPVMEYSVKGRVGGELGYALKGIKVELGEFQYEKGEIVDFKVKKTLKTDKNGKFEAEITGKAIGVRFTDVDGEENGGDYETLTKDLGEYTVTSYNKPKNNKVFAIAPNVSVNQNLKKKQK